MQFHNGWLAFELGVLRRLKFLSVALPFTGEPELIIQLKNWRIRVAANDPMIWSYTKAFALVENNTEKLTDAELELLLDDAYIPREKISNPALLKWFTQPAGLFVERENVVTNHHRRSQREGAFERFEFFGIEPHVIEPPGISFVEPFEQGWIRDLLARDVCVVE